MNALWYGTGAMSRFLLPAVNPMNLHIVAFVDQYGEFPRSFEGMPVIHPSEINGFSYDCILVVSRFAALIISRLTHDFNLPTEKIVSLDFGNACLGEYARNNAEHEDFESAVLAHLSTQPGLANSFSVSELRNSLEMISSELKKYHHNEKEDILFKFRAKISLDSYRYEHLVDTARKQNLRFSAQFAQDIMAYLFFNGKKDGFYIEIGANDGYGGSTTFWAEQLDWKGICVEPQKETFDRLKKHRNCALYNFAISDKTQRCVEFISFPDNDYRSGIADTMTTQHIEEAKKLSRMQTTTIDITTFCDMMKDFSDVKYIDFLSIDTEGHEMNVLRSIDFDKYSFGFITIETEENSDVVKFIIQKGYKPLLTAGSDVIFVPNACEIKQLCCIVPFNCYNKYIDLLKTSLRLINIEPVPQRNIADYVWCHWRENYHEDPNVLLQFKSLATIGKKIIWNFHNKLPHETKNIQKAIDFMRTMANIAHKIIIHSGVSIKIIEKLCNSNSEILSKIVFVPHPYYTGIYGLEKIENSLQNDKLKLCFFGSISKYKNIELLISAIKELNFEDIELNIHGAGNAQYLEYLNSLIGKHGHIKTNFGFVGDKEIPEVLANCHLCVLPYNLDSSLNSGTTILAFSYGRSVISPLTGTLDDIEDKNLFFSYSYEEQSEHKEELKKQIFAIREKYNGNYNELLKLGEKCKKYVCENNSFEQVAKQLAQVFDV